MFCCITAKLLTAENRAPKSPLLRDELKTPDEEVFPSNVHPEKFQFQNRNFLPYFLQPIRKSALVTGARNKQPQLPSAFERTD